MLYRLYLRAAFIAAFVLISPQTCAGPLPAVVFVAHASAQSHLPAAAPTTVVPAVSHPKAEQVKPTDVKRYIPVNAVPLLPILAHTVADQWPLDPFPYLMAAQIEHESCISLTNSRCWAPTAELKTKREYGFGLGQLTIAYNDSGAERFNNYTAMKQQIPALKDWAWADRFNAGKQMTVATYMMKVEYGRTKWATDPSIKYAFSLVAYNGGYGGVLKDRTLCAAAANHVCDPSIWFGHVENYSNKSKVANKGYGKSAFAINRDYPVDIMRVRADKYRLAWPLK